MRETAPNKAGLEGLDQVFAPKHAQDVRRLSCNEAPQQDEEVAPYLGLLEVAQIRLHRFLKYRVQHGVAAKDNDSFLWLDCMYRRQVLY